MEYEIGKYYQVSAVRLKSGPTWPSRFRAGTIIPVTGTAHDDVELGVKEVHYHVDWRFLSKSVFDRVVGWEHPSMVLGVVLWSEDVAEEVTIRRQCKRSFPDYPQTIVDWQPELRKRYATTIAKKGRCPHRGYDMTTIKPDADGCVTCPLHGLKWNATTWQQVSPLTKTAQP